MKSTSKAEKAGLRHADLILEVNGSKIRDMPHEELVKFIRQQSSEDAEALHLTVVSKHSENETLTQKNETVTNTNDDLINDIDEDKKDFELCPKVL